MVTFDDELNAALSGDEPVSDNDEWNDVYCEYCDKAIDDSLYLWQCYMCQTIVCNSCAEWCDWQYNVELETVLCDKCLQD